MSIIKSRLNKVNINNVNLDIKCPSMVLFEDFSSDLSTQEVPRRLRIVPKEFIVEDVKHKLNLPVSVLLNEVESRSKLFMRLWLSIPLTTT